MGNYVLKSGNPKIDLLEIENAPEFLERFCLVQSPNSGQTIFIVSMKVCFPNASSFPPIQLK